MNRSRATARFLAAALLLSGWPAARANTPEKTPPEKTPAEKSAAQKSQAELESLCDAKTDTVSMRLLDGADPKADHAKEAEEIGKLVGKVKSEANDKGQTLSWKRPTSTLCRAQYLQIQRRFQDRADFSPAEEGLVAKAGSVVAQQQAKIKAVTGAELFDGDQTRSGAGPTVAAGAAPAYVAAPDPNAPAAQMPAQYRRFNSAPPARTFYTGEDAPGTRTFYTEASEYVLGKWNGAVAVGRSIKNAFFDGMEMRDSDGIRLINPWRRANFGTRSLVEGLTAVGSRMHDSFKINMAIADISREGGGQLDRHLSHRNGRDVDIGFCMNETQTGKAVTDAKHLVFFNKQLQGTYQDGGRSVPVRFNADLNWIMVKAILQEERLKPTNIFIDNHLKDAILAKAGGSPEGARARALMTWEPYHEDHLHLRVQ